MTRLNVSMNRQMRIRRPRIIRLSIVRMHAQYRQLQSHYRAVCEKQLLRTYRLGNIAKCGDHRLCRQHQRVQLDTSGNHPKVPTPVSRLVANPICSSGSPRRGTFQNIKGIVQVDVEHPNLQTRSQWKPSFRRIEGISDRRLGIKHSGFLQSAHVLCDFGP